MGSPQTQQPPLADIGVNLTDKRFHDDLDAVLTRARDAGVAWQLVTGTSVQGSSAALALSEAHQDLFCTCGVHPHDARHFNSSAVSELRQLASHEKVRAIGECGLDFNRDFSPRPDQEAAFCAQLELAVELQLPVFLHERDAHERFAPILREYRDNLTGVVVHCFTGARAALFDYLDLDCHIGITGWICDERRGGPLRELIVNIPDHRLLIETDSPYLIPRNLPEKAPIKGRNEPALLRWIASEIARLRGQPENQLASFTFDNSCRLFGVGPVHT